MSDSKNTLRKMRVELTDPVSYWLRLGDDEFKLNDLLGRRISLTFLGTIYCIQCGRKTNKSFQQGHCFPCMRRINECNNCMLFPERCQVEEGTCPKDDWAHAQCYQEQYVYLANSSGLKVGITRHTQIPTRWIDQGARFALPIFKVQNRHQVGLVEVAFKQFANDKTNWRAMLKDDVPTIDLIAERARLFEQTESVVQPIIDRYAPGDIERLNDESVVAIDYPVLQYPIKVSSLSLDKTPTVSGVLQGIKGQYLLLDTGVLNIRKFGGYECKFVSE